jgi:hypothetical protein
MSSVLPEYFSWHYGRALRELKELCGNVLAFIYHFFSIPILLRTLFAPWHRLNEGYKGGFDPGSFVETFIFNTLMRFVGALFRLLFIVIGIGCLVASFIAGIILFFFWLILPAAIIVFFIKGLLLL